MAERPALSPHNSGNKRGGIKRQNTMRQITSPRKRKHGGFGDGKPEVEYTFCRLEDNLKSIEDFGIFLTAVENSSNIQNWYQEARGLWEKSKLESLKLFFYQCYTDWVKYEWASKERDHTYILLEFNDEQWNYYADRLVSIVDNRRLPATFDGLIVNLRIGLKNWVDRAKRLQNELMEIILDHTRGEEAINFMDEHHQNIDINMIWNDLILKSPKNLDAFRWILRSGYKVLKITNVSKGRVDTPGKIVRAYNKASLISCVEAYLRDHGDAEWAESPAMKLAKRVAECEAVAESTLYLIKEECKGKRKELFNEMMCVLSTVIEKQLKFQRAYSNDLLSIVFKWQSNEKEEKKSDDSTPRPSESSESVRLIQALRKKGTEVLDLKKMKGNPVGWQFAQRTMVFDASCIPFFISDAKHGKIIEDLTKQQLALNATDLEEEMVACVRQDTEAYDTLINSEDFATTRSTFPLRQDDWFKKDKGDPINQPNVRVKVLEYISLRSTSPDFDAKVSYDFNSYLNQLLTNAHTIDPTFRREMRRLQALIPELKVAELSFGPVKGIVRCKAKAAEEKKAKWPKSATLLDLIRCTFCFENVTDLVAGVKAFRKKICPTSVRRKRVLAAIEKDPDDADKEGLLTTMFELVRLKNGFYLKYNATVPTAPKKYCDVKINLAVRAKVYGQNYGMIGEVQFLLRPMLENKKLGHKLYEVSRNNEGLFTDARDAYKKHFSNPIEMIKRTSNNSAMSEFLLHFSHPEKFHDWLLLERFLKTVALGASFKIGLFKMGAQAYLAMRSKHRSVKPLRFGDEFLCKLVANRSALPEFNTWMKEISDLVGEERFKELLLSRDSVNGYTPLMAYLSNITDKNAFKLELAQSLVPVNEEDEDYEMYWTERCVDNKDRNVVRMCADQCVSGNLSMDDCFTFLDEALDEDSLDYLKSMKISSSRVQRIPMLGMLFDLQKGAVVTKELLEKMQRKFGKFEIPQNEEEEQRQDGDEEAILDWSECKAAPDPGAKMDDEVQYEVITSESFWDVDCKDLEGNTVAHALAYSAAKRGLKRTDALSQVLELCSDELFQKWLVEKVNSRVPLLVYLRNCESVDSFDIDMFKALIPRKIDDAWWTKTCKDESGGNIIHVYCRTAASKQYSPIPALKQIRETLGLERYDKLLGESDSSGFRRNPLLEFTSLSKDDSVTKDETLSMLIPQKRRVLYPAPGSDNEVFWQDKGSNFAIYLVESAAKNSISPTQSLVSLKKMCSDKVYLDLISEESENGYNALTAYVNSCNINEKKLDFDSLGEILQALVPTSFGVKDDSDEWKEYCDESCVSTQVGNPIHLCAAKYARDGIKELFLLECLRKVFDESIWNSWLLSKHNDMIPAITYISYCKHQSDFDINVFKEFLPKPFRHKESAEKGFRVPASLRLKEKVTESKPDAEEKKEDAKEEEKKDGEPEILSAEQFWLEQALGNQNWTVLHLCVHIAKEEVMDPEVAVLPVQELLPKDVFNQMCQSRCKFGANALSHWCWFSKSEEELSRENLNLFIPIDMSLPEHNKFFIENCTSNNGRNLVMKLAAVCSKINIPLLPTMNKWRLWIGEDVFQPLLKMRTQSGMYTCLFVADCGRDDDYGHFIPEMKELLPPFLELDVLDFIMQMPKVPQVMNKEFFALFKKHLDWRSSELDRVLKTHTMTVTGNTLLMEYVMNVKGGYTEFDADILEFWTPDFMFHSGDDHRSYWMKKNSSGTNVVHMVEIDQDGQKSGVKNADMSPLIKKLMGNDDLWQELVFEAKPDFSAFAEDIRLMKMSEEDRLAEQLKNTLDLKDMDQAKGLLQAAGGDLDGAMAIYYSTQGVE